MTEHKCPICGKEFATRRALNQHRASQHNTAGGGRRNLNAVMGPSNLGVRNQMPITVSQTEILWDCAYPNPAPADKLAFNIIRFSPGRCSPAIGILDKFGSMYDNYHVVNCVIEYKPAVGLNSDGKTWCGIDYTTATAPTDADTKAVGNVARLQPNFVTGVVRPARLTVPRNLANPKRIMKTAGDSTDPNLIREATAFYICMGHDGEKAVGLYYIHWTVSFSGLSSHI